MDLCVLCNKNQGDTSLFWSCHGAHSPPGLGELLQESLFSQVHAGKYSSLASTFLSLNPSYKHFKQDRLLDNCHRNLCISQLPISITKYLRQSTYKGKRLLWFIVLDIPVHDQSAYSSRPIGRQHIMVGACGRAERHTPWPESKMQEEGQGPTIPFKGTLTMTGPPSRPHQSFHHLPRVLPWVQAFKTWAFGIQTLAVIFLKNAPSLSETFTVQVQNSHWFNSI